jgi:asparagine synthase (glutamine-hydrolysing)
MSHAFLFVPDVGAAGSAVFRQGVAALTRFKRVAVTDMSEGPTASLAVAPATVVVPDCIARTPDGRVSIAAFGTWLPLPVQAGKGAAWLLDEYLAHGAVGLARRLQGFFALLIVDERQRQVHVVTDRCGSLHVYWRKLVGGHAVCFSSAVLAMLGNARFDPVGVHEFVASGILYEDRSLWQEIHKIGPASVLSFDGAATQLQPYWQFAEIQPESLDLGTATEQTHQALVAVLKALPQTERPLVSDLTGGYDSRFLLSGLLEAERPFATTVSGTPGHPDVTVAAHIASALGLRHQHIESASLPDPEAFAAAVRMTDGEFDAFDYARILAIHRRLSSAYGMSLNGSFGELARGYWWELLWPRLAQDRPLDVAMVARKRFAAVPYDKTVFSADARLNLAEHMAAVAGRAIAPLDGFPNTTQMDCVYYSLRMQRWQGRIASTTQQLWPAFSPIAFAEVLEPILAAKASTRFRSLFVRASLARYAPRLADIPLEHGYPPQPATPFNFWRFAPLVGHYGGKVWGKLAPRLGIRTVPQVDFAQAEHFKAQAHAFLEASGIDAWLAAPRLADSGLFAADALLAFLNANPVAGLRKDQWRRLMTLEALARAVET